MNFTEGDDSALREVCRLGRLDELIEQYISACRAVPSCSGEANPSQKKKRTAEGGTAFPNLAGFCRYIGIGAESLGRILADFPREAELLMAVLEDEALNSSASPTIVAAYLKKRLGYEKDLPPPKAETQLKIQFEHDIFKDGE